MPDIDWTCVQIKYDEGLSKKEVASYFRITRCDIDKAVRLGFIRFRSASDVVRNARRKHPRLTSEETRRKLRDKQLAWIAKHPEMSPTHYHSSKKSFPEKIFEDELHRRGIIGWKYNLPVWKYRFDFAFTEEKIDVEVDGSSHLEPKVADKDRRRDEWSVKNGWTVVRFTASRVKTDLVGCVSDVEKILALKRS